MSWLFILALLLTCRLVMLSMVRGHRQGGHGGDSDSHGTPKEGMSTAELRRQPDELDRLIEQREIEEAMAIRGSDGHLPPRSGLSGHGSSTG